MVDPDQVIQEAQQHKQEISEHAKEALQLFLGIDDLLPRDGAVAKVSEELSVGTELANRIVSSLVTDIVDPVQQVKVRNERYVGVIDYRVFEDSGAYGYADYDDRKGKRKRVVCARCVEQAEYDEEVTHATQGEGSSPEDASWDQLLNKVTSHYTKAHSIPPEQIEPGASLVSGTTVGGNTAWHAGNDGDESGLDADSVDGNDYSDIQNWVNQNADVPNADNADNADQVDGYDIQKNGTDGEGVINFKTN